MFRSTLLRSGSLLRPLIAKNTVSFGKNYQLQTCRSFTCSSIQLAKKKTKTSKKSAKEVASEEEIVEEAPTIDFDDATAKFQSIIEKFNKAASETKLGKSNPKIFDNLTVSTHDGEVEFTSVAQTSVKGRNFIITLFDPENAKHVINTVLGSGLNMNAQIDPTNKFTLKVPLPPITTETKKENAKHLKDLFEKYKHGSTKNNSLSAVRADVRNKFTKQLKGQKGTDAETKLLAEFEKLCKSYNDKLSEAFKAAETAILK
ncbi:ribosomal recycling factor [Scheffersomyces xylosifermentans]|uniref:ribosomal recycling factor n=1 Tax=Scheffersomyces xylosifermentans TaxID=1304137 RepID=UPI00315CD3F0